MALERVAASARRTGISFTASRISSLVSVGSLEATLFRTAKTISSASCGLGTGFAGFNWSSAGTNVVVAGEGLTAAVNPWVGGGRGSGGVSEESGTPGSIGWSDISCILLLFKPAYKQAGDELRSRTVLRFATERVDE